MKRLAMVIAVTTFAAAWTGERTGALGRWLTLIGLLASERFAALAAPRAARPAAQRSEKASSPSAIPFR